MTFTVFLPIKAGRKTTLISFSPDKWGHATNRAQDTALFSKSSELISEIYKSRDSVWSVGRIGS